MSNFIYRAIRNELRRYPQYGGIAPRFTGVFIADSRRILSQGSALTFHFIAAGGLLGINQQLDPDHRPHRMIAFSGLLSLLAISFLSTGPIALGLLWILTSPLWLYALPVIPDIVIENRAYITLPGLAFIGAAVSAHSFVPCVILTVVYCCATHARNEYWRTRFAFWLQAHRECPGKIRPAINFAVALSNRNRHSEAVGIYCDILESGNMHRDCGLAVANLALIYINWNKDTGEQKWLVEAAKILELGKERWPDHPRILYNRGCMYMGFGRWHEAIEEFDLAIQIVPGFAEAYRMRARCWGRLGLGDFALIDAQAAQEEDGIKPVLVRHSQNSQAT